LQLFQYFRIKEPSILGFLKEKNKTIAGYFKKIQRTSGYKLDGYLIFESFEKHGYIVEPVL
jgi:hypothetical protein